MDNNTQCQGDGFANPIITDTSLSAVAIEKLEIHKEVAKQFNDLLPLVDEAKIIESTVPSPSNDVLLHKNYMQYLTLAWSNHFSVVVSPDIIFYTILCEIADEISSNPDEFRHLFTDSTEKKPIMALTHDVTRIDLDQIIKGIAQNMPIDASIFTANFSSSTVESRLAIQAAFCEAMSAYFFYYSTMCGIPRVKVLGTKQDWQTLEHKIHRMRTEVFNQDTTTAQKMSAYLQRAETQVHKIHTTRDPAFWKDMFSINRCMSGHTDVVEGWIVMFYRDAHEQYEYYESEYYEEGEDTIEGIGPITYQGNDFYNYKSHISTVKWHNAETQRHFELKSGLLYSNVVRGDSDDDVKYPWLEPQFSHVIVETDGSDKMTPEQFKNYIEGTLKGGDKLLMKEFYDVLKDDPIELVKGGSKEIDFRFDLISRQIDAWKEDFLKNGRALTKFDLTERPVSVALDFYKKIEAQNLPALEALKEKMIDYLKVNTSIKCIVFNDRIARIEPAILDLFIGNENIEELAVHPTNQESIDKLAKILLHENCKLKCLKVMEAAQNGNFGHEDHTPLNWSILADALVKSSAPLEVLDFDNIDSESLAKAIADLCTRPNGLKQIGLTAWYHLTQKVKEILIRGQVMSKTLKVVTLPELGRFSEELTDLIVNNLPLNPSLETIATFSYLMSTVNRTKALRIPSLKEIRQADLQDLSFLDVTPKLSNITAKLHCTAEQMQNLSNLVSREDCQLETLFLRDSTFHAGAGVTLAKALTQNKSIKKFSCAMSKFGSAEDAERFLELIVCWLEQPYCILEEVHLDDMKIVKNDYEKLQRTKENLVLENDVLRRLSTSLPGNTTLKRLSIDVSCADSDLPLFTELVQKNSTLQELAFGGYSEAEFAEEYRAPLVEAIKVNTSLKLFDAFFLPHSERKYTINEEDLYM